MTDNNAIVENLENSIKQSLGPIAKSMAEASHIPGAELESVEVHAKKIEQGLSQYMTYAKRRCKEGFCFCLESLQRLATIDMAQLEQKIHDAVSRFDTTDHALAMAKQVQNGSSWKELLGLDDTTIQELYFGAKNLFDTGRYPEAEAAFFFLTTIDSKQPVFWQGLGHAAFRLGNLNQAINAYETATTVEPGAIFPHIYIANCFEAMGDLEEALAALTLAEQEFQNSNSSDKELEQALSQRINQLKRK